MAKQHQSHNNHFSSRARSRSAPTPIFSPVCPISPAEEPPGAPFRPLFIPPTGPFQPTPDFDSSYSHSFCYDTSPTPQKARKGPVFHPIPFFITNRPAPVQWCPASRASVRPETETNVLLSWHGHPAPDPPRVPPKTGCHQRRLSATSAVSVPKTEVIRPPAVFRRLSTLDGVKCRRFPCHAFGVSQLILLSGNRSRRRLLRRDEEWRRLWG
jgi:hypothetical protein